jgi:hypothetical protein
MTTRTPSRASTSSCRARSVICGGRHLNPHDVWGAFAGSHRSGEIQVAASRRGSQVASLREQLGSLGQHCHGGHSQESLSYTSGLLREMHASELAATGTCTVDAPGGIASDQMTSGQRTGVPHQIISPLPGRSNTALCSTHMKAMQHSHEGMFLSVGVSFHLLSDPGYLHCAKVLFSRAKYYREVRSLKYAVQTR